MSKYISRINGGFLIVIGIFGGSADLIGYLLGKGPFGEMCFQKSYTIGFFEAHCLAIILGFILFAKSKKYNSTFYNKIAILVELVLFGANIFWFDIFKETNAISGGYIITTAHFVFIIMNTLAILKHITNNRHG